MPSAQRNSFSFKEGLTMMAAKAIGIDPYLAAEGGEIARAAINAIRNAAKAKAPKDRAGFIRDAQNELRGISASQHPKLVNALQAKLLALQGRGGDTQIAHLEPGEMVIPRAMLTPQFMQMIAAEAQRRGIDPRRLLVGKGSINPATGTEEHWSGGEIGDAIQEWFGGNSGKLDVDSIPVTSTRRVETLESRPANVPDVFKSAYTDPDMTTRLGLKVPKTESLTDPFSHKRSGTYVYGGAGMVDTPYVPDLVDKLKNAGVERVYPGNPDNWSAGDNVGRASGNPLDASWGVYNQRTNIENNSNFHEEDYRRATGPGQQLNLVGYSYGGLVAGQSADEITKRNGTVDNLVMLGTPISKEFLTELRANPRIKNVVVKDYTKYGDPVHAGMDIGETFVAGLKLPWQAKDTGHFYISTEDPVGADRRQRLAGELYHHGLR